MVGSWEVVIATLHTDLVHHLLVPLMSYVSIKPSSSSGLTSHHRTPSKKGLPEAQPESIESENRAGYML